MKIKLTLKQAQQLLAVLDPNDTRYYVAQVAVVTESGKCFAVASDGLTLVKVQCLSCEDIPLDDIASFEMKFLVEAVALAKARKAEDVEITFEQANGQYPPFQSAFPLNTQLLCTFDIQVLTQAIKALPKKGMVDLVFEPSEQCGDEALTKRPVKLVSNGAEVLVVPTR